MIEYLEGTRETVHHKENTGIRVYLNEQYEDYPAHWHLDTEIIMPIENYYTIKVGEDTVRLEPHHILLIPPTAMHEIFAPGSGKRIIMNVDSVLLNDYPGLADVLQLIQPYLVITSETMPAAHQRLVPLLEDIAHHYFSHQVLHEAACHSIMLQFFVLLGRELWEIESVKSKKGQHNNHMSRLLETCNYINNHCTEDITLEDMADVAGFSKYHFSRLFKEYMNVTCYEYLTKRRLMIAEKLLIKEEESIMSVALNSGFGSVSTFNRVFREEHGCTPSEFREEYTPKTPSQEVS